MLIQTKHFKSNKSYNSKQSYRNFLYLIIIIKALIHLKVKHTIKFLYLFFIYFIYLLGIFEYISWAWKLFTLSSFYFFDLFKVVKIIDFYFILPFIRPDAIIISFFNIAQIRKFDKLSIKKIVAFSLSIIGYLLYQNYYYVRS